MVIPDEQRKRIWRCLHCHGPLTSGALGLDCEGCAKQYPEVPVTILISDPGAYLRSEIALLNLALHNTKQRRDTLDRLGRDAGLPDASLDGHCDVIQAEIIRSEMLRDLLVPAAKAIETLPANAPETDGVKGVGPSSGWDVDTLLPYLMQDWTDTSELHASCSMISTALCRAMAPRAMAQQDRDYYFLGSSSDETMVHYIDAASIASLNSDPKRVWTWSFYSKSAPQFAGSHSVELEEVNCRTRQRHLLQLAMNDSRGRYKAAWSENVPEPWSYLAPGTLSEIELGFICSGAAARALLRARPGQVTPEQHLFGASENTERAPLVAGAND